MFAMFFKTDIRCREKKKAACSAQQYWMNYIYLEQILDKSKGHGMQLSVFHTH